VKGEGHGALRFVQRSRKAQGKESTVAVNRAQKEQAVSELNQKLQASAGIVLAHNLGLNAADIGDLRKKVRAAKGRFKVAKNTLISRAIKGTSFEKLDDKLVGPTAIVYGEDIFALTKAVCTFTKGNEKLKVVAGAMGSEIMDAAGVETLSKMPSMNELRATIIGLLQAPGTKVARVINLYATKDGSGEAGGENAQA
jgi:large subunit ribosomal protein L10